MINLKIITLVVGPLATNCYLIIDKRNRQGFVLDPGGEPKKILEAIKDQGSTITALVVTHCHFDHLGAIASLKKTLEIPFLIPDGEEKLLATSPETSRSWTGQKINSPPPPDELLKEGDQIPAGEINFQVLSTPGHSPAGICLYSPEEKVIFSGDTLFAGSIGRTDLPGSSNEKMIQSLEKLIALPDKTLVFPGHGSQTTIKKEKETNPFL